MNLVTLKNGLIELGCNQPGQVIVLIEACLGEGISVGSEIVQAVSELGYDRRFVGIQLRTNAGRNRDRYRWVRSKEGTYRLH